MALTAGIVGLPNVGKSTLFNAITKAGAEAANYPFATIDPNVGMVEVPDERLQKLTELITPKKTVPTTFEFTDIAGIVKGASRGKVLVTNSWLTFVKLMRLFTLFVLLMTKTLCVNKGVKMPLLTHLLILIPLTWN